MSAKKTRNDMKVKGGPASPRMDFLVELQSCRACLLRLAAVARGLPEGDDYHDARDKVGTILNRIVQLEEQALRWGLARG